jgi:hypothetical protein
VKPGTGMRGGSDGWLGILTAGTDRGLLFRNSASTTPMQILSFLLLAVVVIGIAGLCYVYKIGPFRPLLSRERYFAIRDVIRTTPTAVIVFGDSIVESAPLPPSICGTPIVNAGIGGAGIDYFVRYSKELLGASAPKLIVLAVGINDAHEETLRSFRSRYQSAVTALSQRAPLVLATIAPVEPGTFTQMIMPGALPLLNKTIKDTGEAIIDLNEQMIGSHLTTDGVHLNAKGYALWTRAIIEGIRKGLGCEA